jgi:(p)ppGpp synthase/HD superfamily hydrolase
MEELRSEQPAGPENNVQLTDRFGDALLLAFDLHRHQRRKGSGIPYIAHVLAVSALVIEDGGDEDEAIAALLHDSVEDHGDRISLAEITMKFRSPRVAEIVRACTDTDPDHRGGDKGPWKLRKQLYVAHVRTGPASLRVSLADKLHNARSILGDHEEYGDAVFERFTASKEDTLWYYRELVLAFRDAGVRGRMIDEFDRTVTALERRTGSTGTSEAP